MNNNFKYLFEIMKKILVVYMCLLATITSNSQKPYTGINFVSDSLPAVLEQAHHTNKIVFIDITTSWCGPCKWMEKHVFSDTAVAAFFNNQFICKKIDAELGEGITIASTYSVYTFPTFLFLDSTGQEIHRVIGSRNCDQFIAIGEEALDPNRQYITLDERYQLGLLTESQLIRYMQLRRMKHLSIDAPLLHYMNGQREADFLDRNNWIVLRTLTENLDSKLFQYMLAHRDDYYAMYTRDSVNMIIAEAYGTEMTRCFLHERCDTAYYQKLRNQIVALKEPELESTILMGDMEMYTALEDWDRWAHVVILYVEKYLTDNDYILLSYFASDLAELTNNQTPYLDKALCWAEKSFTIHPMYENAVIYATLLYRNGNIPKSKAIAEQAVLLAIKEGYANYPEIDNLIQQIELKN